MTITIEFGTPEEEAAFKAKAAAEGLSVSQWIKKLAKEREGVNDASADKQARARAVVQEIREIQQRTKPLGIPVREAIEDGRL